MLCFNLLVVLFQLHFGDALAKILAKETEKAVENSLVRIFHELFILLYKAKYKMNKKN